ncbi:proline dehydrogenase family protein [Rouxiella sp. S1S-2]|uniref:proline dehydrogenase family protein n=1 Tax=Rouxiella sp. S1S-2 TaxID=2653856 RepID=UPI00186ADD58|nr:proline dehydrogenase family protein [Rouxiella sp. S1S-2]
MKDTLKNSLLSRYCTSTLIFKHITTSLLSNRVTKKSSIYLLRFFLKIRYQYLLNTLGEIYFGGKNLEEATKKTEFLKRNEIYSLLDYALEAGEDENLFDFTLENIINTIDLACDNIFVPFVVVKPSSLGAISSYEFNNNYYSVINKPNPEWIKILERYDKIFSYAQSKSVKLMVDAEQSWIQPSVDKIVLKAMKKYNITEVLITLTVQCYKKDSLSYLKYLRNYAEENNFRIGIKLVRGAYLEEELLNSKRTVGSFYTSKDETDTNYQNAIDYIFQEKLYFTPFFATHNENNMLFLVNKMRQENLNFWVGQLYGIGDHVSSFFSQYGIRTCKYIPYGPLEESIPYLLRRIEENAISTSTFKKENLAIRKELWLRLKGFIK